MHQAVRHYPLPLVGDTSAYRVLKEKADHFTAGVGTAWIGVRPIRAATGPGVPDSVQEPVLEDRSSRIIGPNCADVADTACGPAANDVRLKACLGRGLGNHLVAIHGIDGCISVTVENNDRNCRSANLRRRACDGTAVTHRYEGRRKVASGTARES